MKKLILLGALIAGGSLALQDVSIGHGGTYRGPGDTVPPGGGGGGGGGGPSTPGPAGPSSPGGGGPSTPGPAAPGSPSSPGGSGGPKTAGPSDSGPDLTTWQFWWGFNKDPYLNLRAKIHDRGASTGSDVFFGGFGQSESKDSLKPSEETIRNLIVPALLEALKSEQQNDILTGAMIALAKIGDAQDDEGESSFENVIKEFLANSVQEVSETAAVALGILGNPASIPLLTDIANDTPAGRKAVSATEVPWRTRAFATYGLGLVGYRTDDADQRVAVIDTLRKLIDAPEMSTFDVKVAAIIAMGLVPLETPDAPDPEDAKKSSIDPTLSRRHQIEYLLSFFEDTKQHRHVRAHVPRALAQLVTGIRQSDGKTLFAPAEIAQREKVLKSLIARVGRNSSSELVEIRQSSALALGRLLDCDGDKLDKDGRDSLVQAMEDADQQVKNFALIGLAQAAGTPGQTDDPFAGLKDAESLLLKQLGKGGRTKPWAGLALGVMGDLLVHNNQVVGSDANIALRDTLAKTTAPQDVGAYALGSALRGDVEAKQLVFEKFTSISEPAARGDLAIALGLLDAREHVEDIQKTVQESKYLPDLLKQAAIALGLLGDKETVPVLVDMLKNSNSLATQAAIATALGFIGDSRSVQPLIEMLQDKEVTALARAFAAVALGNVADKEPLPWNSKIGVDINYRANTTTLTGGGGTGILDIL